MKALLSPIPAVVLAILLSVGGAFVLFQRQTATAIAAVVAHRAEKMEAARPEKPWDFWTPEMENVAKELAEQRERLKSREGELASWESRIAAERKELDVMRSQIEALRAEIDARLVQVEAQEQRNLKALVNTYSKLTPASAVAIFKQMDDALVAKLLALMKPDVTTAILEELSRDPGPEDVNVKRAAELTKRMRLLMPAPAAPAAAR
jgi:flagellar motility protein MotE (MotC chaperone)